MNKVLAFIGSPRKDGVTARLVQAAGKGAFGKGPRVKYYDLNDPDFRGCQSCYTCRESTLCATQDYLQPFYEEIKEGSGIIFGSPIFFGHITGQSKQFIDRLFPMVAGNDLKPRYPGTKVITILTYGEDDPNAYNAVQERLHGIFNSIGWVVAGSMVCPGTTRPDFFLTDAKIGEAHLLGEKLFH